MKKFYLILLSFLFFAAHSSFALMSVTAVNETCTNNGLLNWTNPTIPPGATVVYSIYKEPSNIIELSNITCNPNGTLEDGSDDYITFSMLAPAPVLFYEAPYTYSVTATQNGNPVTVTL